MIIKQELITNMIIALAVFLTMVCALIILAYVLPPLEMTSTTTKIAQECLTPIC